MGLFYRPHFRILFVSFALKVTFIVVEIALVIAWCALEGRPQEEKKNASAVLEWIVAYVFTLYIFSFVLDLFPSVRTKRHVPQGQRKFQIDETEAVPAVAAFEQSSVDEASRDLSDPEKDYRRQRMDDAAGPSDPEGNYYRGRRNVDDPTDPEKYYRGQRI